MPRARQISAMCGAGRAKLAAADSSASRPRPCARLRRAAAATFAGSVRSTKREATSPRCAAARARIADTCRRTGRRSRRCARPRRRSSRTVAIAASARGERERLRAAFEVGNAALQRPSRRVVRTAVVEAFVHARALLHEGRGRVDRRHDRAGRRVGRLAGVDGARADAMLRLRTVADSAGELSFIAGFSASDSSRSNRVMRPWKPAASAMIATRPRSSTASSSPRLAAGGSVSSACIIVSGQRVKRATDRCVHARAGGPTRRSRRPAACPRCTGSCETSACAHALEGREQRVVGLSR